MGDDHFLRSDAGEQDDEAAQDEAEYLGEIGHWIAAPMKDVGTFEQFHEVVDRAEQVIGPLRALLRRALPDLEIAADVRGSGSGGLLREVREMFGQVPRAE